MTKESRTEDLSAIDIADPEALRAVFDRHSEPAEEWPRGYGDVRRLSEQLVDEDRRGEAAWVLIAALEDLRRFFATPDDDSDYAWRRAEAKRWESWATGRALRSVLVDSDPDVAWRGDVLHAIVALLDDSESSPASLEDLMPLSPADVATLREQPQAAPENKGWTPPEQVIAERLLGNEDVDGDTIRRTLCDEVKDEAFDDGELYLERLYYFSRVSERLSSSGAWEVAAMTFLEALVYAAEGIDTLRTGHSEDAEAVAAELRRTLEGLLQRCTSEKGSELRRRLLSAARDHPEVLRRVRQIIESGEVSEAREEVRELTRRLEASRAEDERREIARPLVFDFGDILADEEYLALCAEFGWTTRQVERLLARGRVDEARTVADETLPDDPDTRPPRELKSVARSFLAHGLARHAAHLLEPFASHDLELARLSAQALEKFDARRATDAYLRWFKMRPTLATYRAIEDTTDDERWPTTRDLLEDHLRNSRLEPTLVDIAVDDGDVEALNELIPTLDGIALEHARGRVSSMKDRLSEEAVAHLDEGR